VGEVRSASRYRFLRYRLALEQSSNLADVWDAKRRAIPGTELPSDFPARAALIAYGYLVTEEIAGADATELSRSGLSGSQAAAVLAALE
jgi:hypothetical protein